MLQWNPHPFDSTKITEGTSQHEQAHEDVDTVMDYFPYPDLGATSGDVSVKHQLGVLIQEHFQQTQNILIIVEAEELLIDEAVPYAPKATYQVKGNVKSIRRGEPSQLLEMDFEDALLD